MLTRLNGIKKFWGGVCLLRTDKGYFAEADDSGSEINSYFRRNIMIDFTETKSDNINSKLRFTIVDPIW